MVNYEVYYNAGFLASAGVAYVSLFCTLLTIWIIVDMKKWNGYMRLVFNLSVCQCFTDFSFILCTYSLYSDSSILNPTKNFFFTFGCISVSLWTNVMSLILFSVVIYRKNLNIHRYFSRIRAMILFLALALGIIFAIYTHKYYDEIEGTLLWSQFVSVCFNLVVWIVATFALRHMEHDDTSEKQHDPGNLHNNRGSRVSTYHKNLNKPIIELSRRIKYYPIVQIISLLGITWYFFGYILGLLGPRSDANLQVSVWYVYSILSPAAGIGYFMVFLTVQPYAYKHLSRRVRELCGVPIDRTISAQSDVYRTSSASIRSSDAYGHSINSEQTRTTLGVTFVSSLTQSTISSSNPIAVVDCAGMDDDALIEHVEQAYRTRSTASGAVGQNPMVGVAANDIL
jgi:hypothetical protein